jgi:type II secretory pathway pseudopilin PulG
MKSDNGQAGFTILEALVAFTILAVFLALLYETLQGSFGRVERARYAAQAALIAESQIELLRARRVEPDWDATTIIPGTRFSVVFVRGDLKSEAGAGGGLFKPVRLTAIVTWNEGAAKRTLPVQTVILAKRGGPG